MLERAGKLLTIHESEYEALAAFFWARVEAKGPDECWPWKGIVDKVHGYGVGSISRQGKSQHWRAHRLSYIIHHGHLPEDLVVRHTCDNRPCVNPHHLLVGTPKDNAQDMMVRGRFRNAHMLQTHCIHGHEFTPENTRNTKRGHRQCKTCQRIIDRRRTALGLH